MAGSKKREWSKQCIELADKYEQTYDLALELHDFLASQKPNLLGNVAQIEKDSALFVIHREALQNFVAQNVVPTESKTIICEDSLTEAPVQAVVEENIEEPVEKLEIEAAGEEEKIKVEKKKVKKVAKEIVEIKSKINNAEEENATAPKLSEEQKIEKKLRSKWYQDPSYAHFTIYYKNLREEQVKVYFEREKLTVDVHFDDGKIAREICHLTHPIRPSESRFTLNKYKISVALKKRIPADWETFVTSEKKTNVHINKAKKFELMENALEEEERKEKDGFGEDPSAGLMGLMKKMYNEGDPEMKKMIAKTMTESQDKRNRGEVDEGGFGSGFGDSKI